MAKESEKKRKHHRCWEPGAGQVWTGQGWTGQVWAGQVWAGQVSYEDNGGEHLNTVELRSKGPGRKGNPPIREKISSPIKHFLFISILAIREFQSMGKIRLVPWNPLERGSTVSCIMYYLLCNSTYPRPRAPYFQGPHAWLRGPSRWSKALPDDSKTTNWLRDPPKWF